MKVSNANLLIQIYFIINFAFIASYLLTQLLIGGLIDGNGCSLTQAVDLRYDFNLKCAGLRLSGKGFVQDGHSCTVAG
jgi:hypothetical protein